MVIARDELHTGDVLRGLLVGVCAGVLSGLFGIGGGALLVVGLLWLGFSQHEAHATSLAAIVLTAAASLVPFLLADEVALTAALTIAPAAMIGAFLGASLMRRIPETGLRIAFAVVLLVVAARMLLGGGEALGPSPEGLVGVAGLAALGLLVGVLSSILGIGGGLVLVPALVLLFGFGQHAAEGTSLAVVVPTALVGAARHSRAGYTDWRRGLLLGSAGILGGLGGANVALALDGLLLQRLFGIFLTVMTLRLLLRSRPRHTSA